MKVYVTVETFQGVISCPAYVLVRPVFALIGWGRPGEAVPKEGENRKMTLDNIYESLSIIPCNS